HDRVLGIQSAVVTMLMNPITLQRVYDAELRRAPDQDALTIPELLDAVVNGAWSELDKLGDGTARKPSISSLRRNLQRELVARMIDLTLPDGSFTAAYRPVQNLTVLKLRELKGKIDKNLSGGGLDPYTKAHLTEVSVRIGKALDATYIYQQ
ncbi:MAG: zinc-dependent metalloprotease, partial [Phycisphaerales bacterium]|nr:zinc-dependent metalloprotease [Phycisphaerales bacterium]